MRKLLIIGSIIMSAFSFAQNNDNPFVYEESNNIQDEDVMPGNPGDPVPIDDYIPGLLIIASTMLVVYAYRKKEIARNK